MPAKYSTKCFLNRKASLSDNPHNLEMFHEELLSEDTMSSSSDCILENSTSIFRKDEILSIRGDADKHNGELLCITYDSHIVVRNN
jgi:hypothetical protein